MKILELFSGSGTFSKIAREKGHETKTLDINPDYHADICMDILKFNIEILGDWKPDIIWASPDCSCFSIASVSTHWNKDRSPKTDKCKTSINVINKLVEIIKQLNPKYFFIENPRGMLRKQTIMKQFNRTTVMYCQYGDNRMKPTDIWSNTHFIGKQCKNGNPCHISAPRGSKTGTQGLKNYYERSKIPKQLAREILEYVIQ